MSGDFTVRLYDPDKDDFSRLPGGPEGPVDISFPGGGMITFIREDHRGYIWIGSLRNGIKCYDPQTGKDIIFNKM